MIYRTVSTIAYRTLGTRTVVAGEMPEPRDVASVGSSEIRCRCSMTASVEIDPRSARALIFHGVYLHSFHSCVASML